MKPAICQQFGIDFPLFAFSHCRDVVAAVTNAGGFGVLGAVAYTPDQLEQELSWIDEHVHGKPYGADIIVPGTFEGKGEKLSRGQLPSGSRTTIDASSPNYWPATTSTPSRRRGSARLR
jgi:NAD(P)H-dependent flavin oxidoreductase YrpB (nitropropane dioxygenase family)